MSQEYKHPIGPPPELVQEWIDTDEGGPGVIKRIAARAAQWGADTELEACVEWISKQDWTWTSDQLRAARRQPPTPTPTEEAFTALEAVQRHTTDPRIIEPLRLALVRLRELEDADLDD